MFKQKSVDAVMASFHKTIADLAKVEARHAEKADHHAIQAEAHIADRRDAMEEAERARALIGRLSELVG